MFIKASSPNPTTRRIRELMDGHTDRHEEAEIISLLREADAVTLNDTLTDLDLNDLFSDVDDRLVGPDNKTELLDMLSQQRLADLNTRTRAAVVEGLMEGWTHLSPNDEEPRPQSGGIEERSIRNVFLGTRGAQLTDLKNAVNAGADHYDMHNLLFHDVDDKELVQQMFDHFQAEGPAQPGPTLKPLSDIDDTFYSSLKDKRYPSKTVYPGVLAFYEELDRGSTEDRPDRPGDLTFITARPEEPTGIIKDHAHRTLRDRGVKEAAVLVGSLTGLISHEKMAEKKLENFEQYTRIFPEYSFTWLGDSGQGDALLGQAMMKDHADRVKGVFIHDVVGLSEEKRAELRAQGVRVFETYLGAGLEAHQLGLISDQGLQRLAQRTQADLRAIDNWDSTEQRLQREQDLARDLERLGRLPKA